MYTNKKEKVLKMEYNKLFVMYWKINATFLLHLMGLW